MLTIYTDGSCSPNPGPGGWAFWIKETQESQSGSLLNTTNNQAELLAIIKALYFVKEPSVINIRSDSYIAIRWVEDIFKKPSKHLTQSQISLLRELCSFHKVICTQIKGHSGILGNEIADQLAGEARLTIQTVTSKPTAPRPIRITSKGKPIISRKAKRKLKADKAKRRLINAKVAIDKAAVYNIRADYGPTEFKVKKEIDICNELANRFRSR